MSDYRRIHTVLFTLTYWLNWWMLAPKLCLTTCATFGVVNPDTCGECCPARRLAASRPQGVTAAMQVRCAAPYTYLSELWWSVICATPPHGAESEACACG
ncbi:hypothetical protein FA95DRAFT_1554678 [Auriscalpium vulgare]|uniref:Uncharacterized protein n=1 Tax=Auriscalpium vulgare TaxID=40419 RepID=A0ACB8S5F2_9AGAM|nr:hypothetical protein FA95DRAFT_1554678 [Auriscalpium vulgare]